MTKVDKLPNGCKIIQDSQKFKFGTDAILLAKFACTKLKRNFKVCDLCTGNGIIPILLTKDSTSKNFIGLEIQKDCVELAKQNVILNGFDKNIKIFCTDIKDIATQKSNINFTEHSFDAITVNPPYIKLGTGRQNAKMPLSIARHEIMCNLEDIFNCAKFLLKDNGSFFMIHRAIRLNDIFTSMKNFGFGAKTIQFVYPNKTKNATMVLIEARKNASCETSVLPSIYIQNN